MCFISYIVWNYRKTVVQIGKHDDWQYVLTAFAR